MYELDDISTTGFHDILLNKYNMSNTPMSDLYITDSMQDMLDIDIKSEVATVVGGPNEFVSLMRFAELPPLDLDSNSVDGDSFFRSGLTTTPPSDIYADMGTCANPNYVMPVSASSISLSSASDDGSLLSSSSMNALVAAQSLLKSPKQTQTINLNMAVRDTGRDPTLPSPKERKSHLTFSPSTLKVPMMLMQESKKVSNQTQITRLNATNGGAGAGECGDDSQMMMVTSRVSSPVDSVRKDLSMQMMLKEEKIIVRTGVPSIKSDYQQQNGHGGSEKRHNSSSSAASNNGGVTGLGVGLGKGNTIKLAAGIGGLTFGNSMQFKTLKNVQKISALGTVGALKRSASPQMHGNRNSSGSPKMFNQSLIAAQQQQGATGAGKPMSGTVVSNGMSSPISPIVPTKTKHKGSHGLGIESEFPKPAYSYSCLIAMALKNSRSGSLPVSEIYSFMCLHFPYFKTAPSGWKNSVRHNLSLNKCFEKIEKPATNGGQRKGCLWAMNPAKINKMDDEVQKWSRKDPLAIRRAMVHPEHLESLERGEMKHGSVNHDDLDPEEDLESDGGPSDLDAEEEADEDVADPEDEEHEEEEADEEDDEEEDDDVVEIMPPPQPIIDVDAESFIINTPESLIDGDEEAGESIDFDLEVPDFYDNINVDSKDGSLAVELTPQDLLTLEDEDESLYINQSQQQTQQPQVVHRLHQQRPIIRQTQIISQNHRQQHQQQQHQQEQQPAKRARLDVNYRISPNLKPVVSGNGGVVSVLSNRQPMTMTMAASPTSGSPVTLQSTVTSKGITIINSNGTINSVAGAGTTTFSFQQQGFARSAQVQLTAQQHQQLLQQQRQQQQQQSQSNHRRKMPMVTRLA
uniref:Fork-head domain-containing protein n=1 Tax=Anopheles albimanus TaxID=7167 RepID=A0A8W7JZC2_ANOAL